MAISSPTAIPISASTISVSIHVPQYPTAPAPCSVTGCLGADRLGALEGAPPERDGPREADGQREQALELERRVREGVAHEQHGLAQQHDEEQPDALDEMPTCGFEVPEVDASTTTGQPVQVPPAGVGGEHRKAPQHQARIAVGDHPGQPEDSSEQFPDESVDEVLAERPAAQGHDQER